MASVNHDLPEFNSIIKNPMIFTPYFKQSSGEVIAPGAPQLLITQDGKYLVTQDNKYLITQG
jgi:hypothetical protein